MIIKKFNSKFADNQEYSNIHLKNQSNMEVILSSLGAGIKSIKVPDYKNQLQEVTLCPVDEDLYPKIYHGKTVGRTAGRIKGATFTIDGRTANLEKNNFNEDNLHGGKAGFNSKLFTCQIKETKDFTDVIFSYFSKDLEGGYFGNVNVDVTYRIFENENVIKVMFDATSDCKTLLNLTNHAYFNMSGNLFDSVHKQVLYLNASKYGVLNQRLIIENIEDVTKEMDFRTPHLIGDYILSKPLQTYTNGYDHPFFLDSEGMDKVQAYLYSPSSRIKMEVRTTYPCIVVYSNGQVFGPYIRNGIDYSKMSACCLECQFHPDGIHALKERNGVFDQNHPYHEEIEFKFLVEEI